MDKFKSVDYVMKGDGEISIPPLIEHLKGKIEEKKVPNLVWRDLNGNVEINDIEYLNNEKNERE